VPASGLLKAEEVSRELYSGCAAVGNQMALRLPWLVALDAKLTAACRNGVELWRREAGRD
jgi:hypothetical protein